jgi:hypothetical protein
VANEDELGRASFVPPLIHPRGYRNAVWTQTGCMCSLSVPALVLLGEPYYVRVKPSQLAARGGLTIWGG